MKRVRALSLLVFLGFISSACYVKQDEAGNWWACETYDSATGPLDTCYPLP
jgi:hypothetical protein